MKQFYLITFFCVVFSLSGFSQTTEKYMAAKQDTELAENLTLYPNPASHGKVYISSKNNKVKKIEIFNVLGKLILSTTQLGNELNISKLKAGAYIVKISEESLTVTRKLIVR
ncbi:T9SS type A sorting domain-containing protein [Mangrovimonas sp. AS39]|uniref:T9SS type A sorting domain-containing protein n=1 Tax=Mangrovimonas TaxID=1211036 RepID=UPI0014216525|nr:MULTISPECIES: T9SS type A sorting domain-containing protein [Mangrovimonas]MCF1191077.1 T9SS type A sorting domain-containing protein [Mangrovimonas futianensis]MCF1194772.1 T9SS type A sorting domain-containing protein [Mangrovimonas futianensis]NIK91625.1 T9SS type A sorting domain-containing protein [Mangrovimonas sp. CR14]